MKKTVLIMVVLILVVSLAGCGGVAIDEGKETFNAFLSCIENEDYEGAVALSHPSAGITADALRDYVEKVENQAGVDFSKGVSIDRITGFMSNFSTSGSSLEMEGKLIIDAKSFSFRVVISKNSNGYGVSNFSVSQTF